MRFVQAGDRTKVDWDRLVQALRHGHQRPKAEVSDSFLGPSSGSLLSRSAYIEGLGFAVKSASIFPGNPDLPTVQSVVSLFHPDTGTPEATLDGNWVTNLKTAADSVFGATMIGPSDPKTLLSIGGGTVAEYSIRAYLAVFPSIRHVRVWSRTQARIDDLRARTQDLEVDWLPTVELSSACSDADVICSSTMATQPVIHNEWIQPGTHLDLVGAFKADMREASDGLMARAQLFVDNRDTTLDHIGELSIPLASGVIHRDDIIGDYYDLPQRIHREPDAITLCKNGGGAHLDLMVARSLLAE